MKKEIKIYFLWIFVYLFLSILFIEIVFKLLTFNILFDKELIRIILFCITISMILSYILSFFKPIISKIFIPVIIFLVGLNATIQLGFKTFMDNYMSLNIATGGQLAKVTGEIKDFMSYLKPIYFVTFIPFIIFIVLLIIKKTQLNNKKYNFKNRLLLFLIIIISYAASISTLYIPFLQNKISARSTVSLYNTPLLQESVIKQFGVTEFFIRDFIYLINPFKKDNNNIIVSNNNEKEQDEKPNYERHIDDTNWDNIISSTTDKDLLTLHNYYKSQNITIKNEMTGLFENKNIIYIMVEAFSYSAINQELTPTLYKLMTEGWQFDNYYAPPYSCTTGESEFIGLTSIVPSSTVCTPDTYKNNSYPTSIFNLFNNSNYYTSSYHNWIDEFYPRNVLHKNMGSSIFYDGTALDTTKGFYGWPSDLKLIENALPHFIDEEKFMSFIITSSMHFPYDTSYDTYANKYYSKLNDYDYPYKLKRYLAKSMDFDASIEYLLKALEEKCILDDTVIVLFGDHHPLKMEYDALNILTTYDIYENFNINRMPLIIYNSELTNKTYSGVSSTFDLVPTIANLFNLDYDPRYYVGKDYFSTEEKIVVFTTGDWVTDKALYKASTGTYKALTDEFVDDEYIKQINDKVNNYMNVSQLTLDKNYYKYRFPN